MKSRPRVVIVGGGIGGLATAHFLHRRLGTQVQLTIVEGAPRLGGKVATQRFSGHLVDTGPDALLVRSPAMAALLEDLGLHHEQVAPALQGAHVWSRGRLRPLPSGTLFGIPDRLLPLLRSRLLSPAGLARAALDLVESIPELDPGLQARAGVLTGEAAVTIGAEGEGMIAGDLVNTASRVQSVAEPGSVYVGESTRRATEQAVVYEQAGNHELPGKSGLVPLWRALRIGSAARYRW